MKKENVAILGASDNSQRYSYKAYHLLKEKGHTPFLINPNHKELMGQKCYGSVKDLSKIDTITVYVNPQISDLLLDELLKLCPKRIIFNPGSENPNLYGPLVDKGIKVEEACTLVLLNTEQY